MNVSSSSKQMTKAACHASKTMSCKVRETVLLVRNISQEFLVD